MSSAANIPADQKPWPEIKKLLESRISGCKEAVEILNKSLKGEADKTKQEEIERLIKKIEEKKDALSKELSARVALNDISAEKDKLADSYRKEYERYNTINQNIVKAKKLKLKYEKSQSVITNLNEYIKKATEEKQKSQSVLGPVKAKWDELQKKRDFMKNEIAKLESKYPGMYKNSDKIGDPCTVCIGFEIASYAISESDEKDMVEKDKAAVKEAVRLVDDAINRLEKAKENADEIVTKYFGISGTTKSDKEALDNIIGKYKKIQETLKAGMPDGFKISHLKLFGDRSNTNAFVSGFKSGNKSKEKTVFTSKDNFYKNSKDDTRRGAIILHELSHGVAETEDVAYDWQAKFSTLTSEESQKNADSFEEFSISSLKETELQKSKSENP